MTDAASLPRPGCPPWCTSKHAHDYLLSGPLHVGQYTRWIPLTDSPTANQVYAAIVQSRDDDNPYLTVNGHVYGNPRACPAVPVSLADAEHLASLIGMLADATPEAHREIADAIRRTEAIACGDVQPGAGRG